MTSPSFEMIMPPGEDTLLRISGMGDFQFQARGLTQTLSPIREQHQTARTINGHLIDISNPAFRKYQSRITCTDVNTPPFDGIWAGMTVTVECTVMLCYKTGNSGSPFRSEVSGSSHAVGDFIYYRPALTMMVMEFDESFDEWGCRVAWSLQLEEV